MLTRILLLVALLGSAGAQNKPSQNTAYMSNGRFWAKLPPETKWGYIAGIWDTARLLSIRDTDEPDQQKIRDSLFVPSLGVEEVAKELDRFYHEPANAPVPIVMAMTWASAKARGESQEKMDDMAATLRKFVSEIQNVK